MDPSPNLLQSRAFIQSLVPSSDLVASWTLSPGCEAGDNVAGQVQALQILTTQEQQPPGDRTYFFMFKSLPPDPRPWMIERRIFRVEHAVYRTLAPALEAFAPEVSYKVPLPPYISGFNNDKDDYLVMGDLRPQGYTMRDKRTSLTFPETVLVLEELAKFHAVSYAFLQQEKYLLEGPDLDLLIHRVMPPDAKEEWIQMLAHFFKVAVSLLPLELRKRGESVVPKAGALRKAAEEGPSFFKTMIHGDLWTNNVLFKQEDDQGGLALSFIDFQFTFVGPILSDLEYFLFTSTTPEFRKEHGFSKLLRVYHWAFRRMMEGLKTPMPPGFTARALVEEFKGTWWFAGLVHTAFAIALQLGDFPGVIKDILEKGEDPDSIFSEDEPVAQLFLRSPIALRRWEEVFMEAVEHGII